MHLAVQTLTILEEKVSKRIVERGKGTEDVPRVHLGHNLELVLDGGDLLGRGGLGTAKAEEGHFGWVGVVVSLGDGVVVVGWGVHGLLFGGGWCCCCRRRRSGFLSFFWGPGMRWSFWVVMPRPGDSRESEGTGCQEGNWEMLIG